MSIKWYLSLLLAGAPACQPGEGEARSSSGVPSPERAGAESEHADVPPPDNARGAAGRSAQRASKVTVLFLGTSLTAGYGLEPEQAFPSLIQQRAAAEGISMRAINAGLSGETSAGALRRIDWVMRQPADVVVVETGGNDGLRGLDARTLESNLDSIVSRIRRAQPQAQVVLVQMEAPPNLGASYTTRFRSAYANVAAKHRVKLIPFLLEGVAGKAELNLPDGIHPNLTGERIVADNIWRELKPLVQQVANARDATAANSR